MKDKLLLVGAGGFGRVAMEHARREYDCYFVDDSYPEKQCVCGVPIVGKIADLPALFSSYKRLVVAIGNMRLREQIYQQAKEIGYEFINIFANDVYISPFAKIGKGCVFLNHVVVQNGACIGDGVLLNAGVIIHHDSSVGDHTLIYSNSVVRTYAHVGRRVKIGSTVSISMNAQVADDEIIEDGTVRGAV